MTKEELKQLKNEVKEAKARLKAEEKAKKTAVTVHDKAIKQLAKELAALEKKLPVA